MEFNWLVASGTFLFGFAALFLVHRRAVTAALAAAAATGWLLLQEQGTAQNSASLRVASMACLAVAGVSAWWHHRGRARSQPPAP